MSRKAEVACGLVALLCCGEALGQPCSAIPSAPCAYYNGTTFDGGNTLSL